MDRLFLILCLGPLLLSPCLHAYKVVPTMTRDGDPRILDRSNYPFIAEHADGIRLQYKDWTGYSEAQIATIFDNLTNKNCMHHAVWHGQDLNNTGIVRVMPPGSNVLAFMLYQEGDGMFPSDWEEIVAQDPDFPVLAHTRKYYPDGRSTSFRAQIEIADGAEFEFRMDDPSKHQQAADLLEYCVENNKICSFLTTYQRDHDYNLSAYKVFYYYLKKYFRDKDTLHLLHSDLVIFNVNAYANDEIFPDADHAGGTFGTSRWLIQQKTADDWVQPTMNFTAPTDEEYLDNNADLTVRVNISYAEAAIAKVELFFMGQRVGEDTAAPYQWSGGILNGLNAGKHQLKAVATDVNGKTSDRIIDINVLDEANPVPSYFTADGVYDFKLRNLPDNSNIRHVYRDEWVTYAVNAHKAGLYDIDVDLKVQRSKQYGGTIIVSKGLHGSSTEIDRFTTVLNDPDQPALSGFEEHPHVPLRNVPLDEGLNYLTFTFAHPLYIKPQFQIYGFDFRLQGAPTISVTTPARNDIGAYEEIVAPGNIVVEASIVPDAGTEIQYADLFLNGQWVRRITTPPFAWNDLGQDSALNNLSAGTKALTIVTEDDANNLQYQNFDLDVVNRRSYTTLTIPSTIQAWHFDIGGEGSAYHDFNIGYERGLKDGSNPRYAKAGKEDVEIDAVGSDYAVSGIRKDEWLSYTIATVEAGVYDVSFLAATRSSKSARVNLILEGQDIGEVTIHGTGSAFSNYENHTASGIQIEEDLTNAELQLLFEPLPGTSAWLFFFREFAFTKTSEISQGKWGPYDIQRVDGNQWVDTGDWLGWVYIESLPYAYLSSTDNWAYIASEPTDSSLGGWCYFFR